MPQGPASRKPILRKLTHQIARLWHRVRTLKDHPERIALGFAIGFFIGWLPIVGVQMVVCGLLCLLLRANFLATLPGVWLSNPATMVPMYLLENWLGSFFVGKAATMHEMQAIWDHIGQLITDLGFMSGVWEGTMYLLSTAIVPYTYAMFLGGAIIGTINALAVYWPCVRFIRKYQHTLQQRRAHWRDSLKLRKVKVKEEDSNS